MNKLLKIDYISWEKYLSERIGKSYNGKVEDVKLLMIRDILTTLAMIAMLLIRIYLKEKRNESVTHIRK